MKNQSQELLTLSKIMNKLIIIYGYSSGGKSTLLSELSQQGYSVVPEVDRELVKEQLVTGGTITPWNNPIRFCEKLIEKSAFVYHQAILMTNVFNKIIFFDRCILEGISWYQRQNFVDSNKHDHFIHEFRYYPAIFMAPPWQ